ncbi:hypothetical protein ASD04_07050 [Devosia sp. Root436]|uniref:hypothetical protein n=1 Tax=Devosia sp. Root436 TaxID=1736537 RepID=UPI0006F5B08B|nr:hypothetical protein [Devosia sp. Root436]KQX40380.1 hypothetical protein ASD04_07050 [Devosia sp. Root436]
MNLRPAILAFVATVVILLAASTWWLPGQLHDARAERDAAFDQRDAAFRAIDELAAERAAADRRNAIVQERRESIIAAPDTEDGDVAPVLWDGLRAADEIGGVE